MITREAPKTWLEGSSGVRASLLPGGRHCPMAEGQASHMAASVWGLGGKKAWRFIVPSIDFDLHFPLCCGHVSMPRASVPQGIGLPPPAGVGSKRSFLAEWLGEGEVCGPGRVSFAPYTYF